MPLIKPRPDDDKAKSIDSTCRLAVRLLSGKYGIGWFNECQQIKGLILYWQFETCQNQNPSKNLL